MTAPTSPASGSATTPRPIPPSLRIIERNAMIALHYWKVSLSRLFEPFLFLFSVGVGVGALVEGIVGPDGAEVPYRSFVAPALVVTASMNAAVFAGAMDVYAKFKWMKTYESMLATPLSVRDVIRGELGWIIVYLLLQSTAFVVTMAAMGLIESWWGLLLVPTASLVAFAFASAAMVGASYLRTWLDFDYVFLVTVPLYLFSASFFPLERYPDAVASLIRITPLYQGVSLARDLSFGTVGWSSLLSVLYLLVMGRVCLAIADRRLARMLQP